MTTIAYLNDIALDNLQIGTSSKNTLGENINNDSFLKKKYNVRNVQLSTVITDEIIASQIREFISNRHKGIIDFSSSIGENLSGLYLLINGDVSLKEGHTYWLASFTLEGKYNFKRWSISQIERETYWDILDECSDGDYTSLVGYSTSGTVSDGGDHILFNNGYLVAGYDFFSDFIVEGYFADTLGSAVSPYVYLRFIDTSNYIKIIFDQSNDLITLEIKFGGNIIVDRNWNFELDYSLPTVFKCSIAGNKVSAFCCQDTDELPDHVFTYSVDHLQSGKYGFGCSSQIELYDIIISQSKPRVIQTPVGTYEYNDTPMQDGDRLYDDTNIDGSVLTFINPRNNLKFRQSDLTGSLNDAVGGDVKVYDDMNEVSESDWVQVFHPSHQFTGKIVITNGLIRIREIDSDNWYFGCYTQGSWEEITVLTQWSVLSIESAKRVILSLSPNKVEMKEIIKYDGGSGNYDIVWTEFTMYRGQYLMHIVNRRSNRQWETELL